MLFFPLNSCLYSTEVFENFEAQKLGGRLLKDKFYKGWNAYVCDSQIFSNNFITL